MVNIKNEIKELIIEGPTEGVVQLRLNRPKKMNAIRTSLLSKLANAIEELDADEDVRAFVITGGDKVFAAGADVNEIKPKQAAQGLSDERPALWAKIRCARKPIIAAVEGFCLGAGNELMLCADITIAGASAKFGQPESNLGIIPGAGGASILPRIIGSQRAMRMVLLGEFIRADEALQYGLISEIVPEGEATQKAIALAKKIASRAPLAVMQGKAVIKAADDMALDSHLRFERQAFSLLFSTQDKSEGVSAFIEKRKPVWTGQ